MKLKFTLFVAIAMGLLSALETAAQKSEFTPPKSEEFTPSFEGQRAIDADFTALSGYGMAGTTVEIPFRFQLLNEDFEWGDSLSMTFPAGVTPVAVSNDDVFGPVNSGATPEDYNGVNGQTISWGDNDNEFGGIIGFNTNMGVPVPALIYEFTVTVDIDPSFTGDMVVDFHVSGDGFGDDPADQDGQVTVMEPLSLAGIIINSADHTTLETALNAAGLMSTVATATPLTIFAPNDQAFEDVEDENPGTLASLLDPANVDVLTNILLYHVTPSATNSGALSDGLTIPTLEEFDFELTVTIPNPGEIFINGEQVINPFDVDASNGVLHNLSGVLLPPTPIELPIDFELEASNYQTLGFNGADFDIIPNPGPDDVNGSATVARLTKNPGAEVFAGGFVELNIPIDFVNDTRLAIDVWSPDANTVVRLQPENGNDFPDNQPISVDRTMSTTGAWETLIFDFSEVIDPTVDYLRVTVIMDFGNPGPVDPVEYYFDNVRYLPTVFDIVEASEVHNTLQAALEASGLNGATDNIEADLTLFAPTDEAFSEIQMVLDELEMDPTGALANVLLYHVVVGTNLSGDLVDGSEVVTAQGETVTITNDGAGNVTVNGVDVVIADLPARNGVVHVIEAVLVPELCLVTDAFYATFLNDGGNGAPAADAGVCPINFSPFQSWASEAYQVDNFVTGTTYTFGLTGGDIGAWDPQLIVQNASTGEVVAVGEEGETALTFEVPVDGTYLLIVQEVGFCGGQSSNLETNNGFPYITCESSLTITDIVVASEDHNTLETAVVAAGLDGTLAGEGPFTVFAPTDDAFDLLPDGLLDDLLDDVNGLLIPVLQHHVVPAIAYSVDLSDGQVLNTLNEDVVVGIDDVDGSVSITASFGGTVANVEVADIVASNGVIHVVDAVLTPSVLSVDNLQSVESLGVYPNPTNNQFTVDINTNATERITIDIVNIMGQVVKSVDLGVRGTGMNREFIDVNELSNGMYFMNITVGEDTGTVKVQIAR